MKVTVIGAGAVGASCTEYIAMRNFASEVAGAEGATVQPKLMGGKAAAR